LSKENPNRCPNCGYSMQNLYTRSKNSEGKETWKTIGSKFCEKCNIEKPSKEIKIIC